MYLPNELRNIKVLITVKTYPLPSNKYCELVCTAGILENGKWIRIYPIPFLTLDHTKQFQKYQWIHIDLIRNSRDFRLESYRPIGEIKDTLHLLDILDAKTKGNWDKRKQIVLKNTYDKFSELLSQAYSTEPISLATIKPQEIIDFEIEPDERDWKIQWAESYDQYNIFNINKVGDNILRKKLKKVPYKYFYKFITKGDKKPRRLMIEDWEIGALYWKCLSKTKGDETEANKLVKHKYFVDLVQNRDLYLFVGTTLQFHLRKAPNPFVIIGAFYPPKLEDIPLFM